MNDLLSAFSAACVSTEPNSISAQHPRFALYKVKQSKFSQSERRRKFLEAQKSKRFDYVNHARQLAIKEWQPIDCGNEQVEEESVKELEEMDIDLCPTRSHRIHKDQLMMSEWMVEVPEDLSTNWLLVLCPVGKRSLVIASKGYTRAYSRNGFLLNSFPSSLPGGNRKDQSGVKNSSYTILDCIYNELEKTYYILDMMCWNGHPLYDSETEFRFYWVHTKLSERPQVMEVKSANPYKFVPLPYYCCDEKSLKEILWSPLPFSCQLDGLLFFHKKTHYVPRRTPLICWLKAFMVPEILNIHVPENLCSDKPSDYTTMRDHVPKAFEESERRKEKDARTMQVEES